jgi:hypothetical protein
MNHLNEEELIEFHYGESTQQGECQRHLESCEQCAAVYATLAADISRLSLELEPPVTPERSAEYGGQVWQSIRPSLMPYEKRRHSWLRVFSRPSLKMALALGAAAAVLAVGAFYSGRLWEQKRAPTVAKDNGAAGNLQAQRVILLVLSDHLDRSERLLVELNHPEEAAVDPALQTTARQLLDENRRYRQTAARSDAAGSASPGINLNNAAVSPAVKVALDDLDRVLTQVADSPDGLSRTEIAQVQKEMNATGLLFEVRILRSRVHSKQASTAISRQGGTIL